MTPTFASVFTGGRLADIGAEMAGYETMWGNEIDPDIAEIATANGGKNIVVGNILDINPRKLDRPNWFHASPPCPNFSVAKAGATETALDIALAEKVAEFIVVLRPPAVTIENVPAYLKSKSYRVILRALEKCGYMYDARVLCSADFSVPQTRRRLIVRAVLGGLVPNLPSPTPWIGWYAAIEDILDTLPESEFAPWQMKRLGDFVGTFMLNQNRTGADWAQETDLIKPDYPAMTVSAQSAPARAFLMGGNSSESIPLFTDAPAPTVVSNTKTTAPRAFLVGDQKGQFAIAEQPAPTVRAGENGGTNPRAWLSQGRVVKMTVQAMARFQTLPDWYQGATIRIIGNGIPCKLMQAIGEAFLRGQE